MLGRRTIFYLEHLARASLADLQNPENGVALNALREAYLTVLKEYIPRLNSQQAPGALCILNQLRPQSSSQSTSNVTLEGVASPETLIGKTSDGQICYAGRGEYPEHFVAPYPKVRGVLLSEIQDLTEWFEGRQVHHSMGDIDSGFVRDLEEKRALLTKLEQLAQQTTLQ